MRVLIGYSTCQETREAFESTGCEAYTCDLLGVDSQFHIQQDIWLTLLHQEWDFAVLHPMCTYLTTSAAWAYGDGPYHQKVRSETLVGAARRAAREEALDNFRQLLSLPFPVAIENPARSFINKAIRPPDQVIQPHEFGDDASKATGLWLSAGVPKLVGTKYVEPRMVGHLPRWANQTDSGQNRLSPSADRWLERSKTYPGIAKAMGNQWGLWLMEKSQ